jgi:hypothetical protein
LIAELIEKQLPPVVLDALRSVDRLPRVLGDFYRCHSGSPGPTYHELQLRPNDLETFCIRFACSDGRVIGGMVFDSQGAIHTLHHVSPFQSRRLLLTLLALCEEECAPTEAVSGAIQAAAPGGEYELHEAGVSECRERRRAGRKLDKQYWGLPVPSPATFTAILSSLPAVDRADLTYYAFGTGSRETRRVLVRRIVGTGGGEKNWHLTDRQGEAYVFEMARAIASGRLDVNLAEDLIALSPVGALYFVSTNGRHRIAALKGLQALTEAPLAVTVAVEDIIPLRRSVPPRSLSARGPSTRRSGPASSRASGRGPGKSRLVSFRRRRRFRPGRRRRGCSPVTFGGLRRCTRRPPGP